MTEQELNNYYDIFLIATVGWILYRIILVGRW